MTTFPDRLSGLIKLLEAGETIGTEELKRIATLQALDMATLGREFVVETIAMEEAALNLIEKVMLQ